MMSGGVISYDHPPAVFVFNANIQSAINDAGSDIGGLDPVAVTKQVTIHELVHTFDVNPPARLTTGHCGPDTALNGWQGGHCLMNPGRSKAERGSVVFSLHVDPWTSSEYRRVRHAPEPLPMVFQSDVAPNP
jgi:hypothetical protein